MICGRYQKESVVCPTQVVINILFHSAAPRLGYSTAEPPKGVINRTAPLVTNACGQLPRENFSLIRRVIDLTVP